MKKSVLVKLVCPKCGFSIKAIKGAVLMHCSNCSKAEKKQEKKKVSA